MRLSVRCSWVLGCALICAGCLAAQAVISAHAGVLNYSEGTLLLDDQPLKQKPGTFTEVRQGSVLRTETGRAEILLGPGVFLRLDENSAVRMISTALASARVEFLHGSAIVDTNDAAGTPALTLVYKNFEMRFPKSGVYRIDSDPGVFETYTGQAEIRADGQTTKTIDESNQFFFGIGMETKKYGEGAIDNFSEWCRNRAEALNADQQAANQSNADPNDPSLSPFGGVDPGQSSPVAPAPSYGFPGLGSVTVAPLVVDNGFGFAPYGPIYNQPFYTNPLVIFWVFPRKSTIPPRHGTPPLRSGYPSLPPPPRRVGYPQPSPWQPRMPMPLHNSAAGYYRPPVVHTYVSPAHASTPIFHAAPAPSIGRAISHR